MSYAYDGWHDGSVGDFLGVPVIESRFVPKGSVFLVDRGWVESPTEIMLYDDDSSTVSAYIKRKANALRKDLGLPLVNYRWEAAERSQRTRINAIAEARLGMVMTAIWPIISW